MNRNNNSIPWYKNYILLLIIAIPLATLIGSGFTLYLAISTKESPVLESYKRQGLAPVKMEQALGHGIVAQIIGKKVFFHGAVVDKPIVMTFEHPSLANQDWKIVIKPAEANQYDLPQAAIEAMSQRWYIRISDSDWQISGSTYDRETRDLKTHVTLQ